MISSFVRALVSAFKARRELALENVALRQQLAVLRRCFRNQMLAAVAEPARVLEFEPDFERRSSLGDTGWADHAVPDVQGHLRVHADVLIRRDGVRRPTDTSIQMPLAAYQHLMAEAPDAPK